MVLVAGCAKDDTTPPVAPWVDELASPVAASSPILTGTAEFGALVRVAGGAEAVETTADPYTARWRIAVPLAVGSNTLSVTATDAAGNQSAATEVALEHIPAGAPASVVLTGPDRADAGAAVEFAVSVVDAYGTVIPDAAFTLTSDAPGGSTTFEAPASLTFCALGDTIVTAEAGDGGPSATLALEVEPGAPVVVALATTPSPAVVEAGDTVSYTTETLDVCGNQTADAVSVYTNAPGAVVAAGNVTGLVRAGSWTLVAEVPGTSVADSESLLVSADSSSVAVALSLTSHSGIVGLPVGYSVIAVDGFGNPVAGTPVIEVSTDPAEVVDAATQTIEFSIAGTHTVTATVAGASDSDFVVVTDPDVAIPDVAITAPAAGLVFAPGGTITVTVEASDDRGLAQIYLQASGQVDFFGTRLVPVGGGVGAPFVATFAVDVGNNQFGDITFVAQAVDLSGNYSTSTEVVIQVDPAINLVAPGLVAETVAFGGLLNNPRGLAVDAAGNVYVANRGNGTAVVRIDAVTGAQSAFTPSIGGANPEDIVFHPATGNFFLTATGTDDLYRVSAVGAPTTFSTVFGGNPHGIALDSEAGGERILVLDDTGTLRRFNPASAPLTAPTFTMDASPPLDNNPYGVARVSGTTYAGCDEANEECWTFTAPAASAGAVTGSARRADSPPLTQPRDLVLSPDGSALYVANEGDGRIIRVTLTGCTTNPCPTTTIVSGLDRAWGLVFVSATVLLISDEQNDVVYRLTGTF